MERVEDLRMVRGAGQYVADVNRPNQLYAVILRSSIAHGVIRAINSKDALGLEGVHAVLTGKDFGNTVPRIPLRLQPLPQLETFHQPVIADGKVRYVGEPIAVVVADSQAIAEDALDLISIDIDSLPAIANRNHAEAKKSLVFEEHGSNVAITWHAFKGNADEAFKNAEYVRREKFQVQRHAAMFMEPRGFVADWNETEQRLTVWGAAKTAWHNRRVLAAQLGLDVEAVDLVEVDVGGGFGSRGEFYPEDFLIPASAKIVGRPVKWIEDRREHMMSANHARDVECEVEFAATKDGKFIALRGQAWCDIGAYVRTNGSVGPRNVAQYMVGPYCFEHVDLKSSMLTTNKTPCGTYRGPGRYETDFIRERMIDLVAKDLNIDRVEIRRRNLVADAQMPYPLPSITPYDSSTDLDSGDYHTVFDRCLKEFNWEEKSKLRGREIDGYYHGLAIGSFIEGGAAGPKEEVRLVLETDGSLSVYMGSSSVGQGLETIMAQIAADAMEVAYDKIRILHGSTRYVKDGYGAYHSRSTVMGGSAILLGAEKLKELIRQKAAERLGCNADQISLDDEFAVFQDTRIPFSELSAEPLEVEAAFFNKKYTWAYGTQAAHVAVDPETGHVKVLDMMSVEDVGRMINPLTLHGQALGSMVQGLGGAFLEHLIYDDEGQLLTGSFADYLMPTASDFPKLDSITLELKPCPNNPLGAKGAGEGGLIPIGGLMANAVADALSHLNVQPMELPLSPPRIWRLVEEARARQATE
ncbi:MAG TPA: xanthine dehydrogenase family protein molybdopterin-binding subunit [Afipia sp.]